MQITKYERLCEALAYTSLILLLPLLLSCRQQNALERALVLAGDNRHELEQVLEHYKNDSLKQEAARFLIENMPYHSYLEEYYLSPTGEKYRPKISDFRTDTDYRKHIDSLMNAGCSIVQKKKMDIETIDSTFLVHNIELAFIAWKKPWAKQVPFSAFCRYILPYRGSTEYPSGLRDEVMSRFIPLLDSAQVNTSLEACMLLNKRLKEVMGYKKTDSPFYPMIEETYKIGIAQCEGLCDLGIFIMRAAGIPVVVEQTVWTRMDLGHSWCAVWDNGRFYCFEPGEEPFDKLKWKLKNVNYMRPAKIYRFHFEQYSPLNKTKDDEYTTWLKSPFLQDVTLEYLDSPINISVKIDKSQIHFHKSEQVYLCTYNYYKWEPIAMGYHKDSTCLFSKVACDNIFIVANSPTGKGLRFLTAPFYIDKQGNIRKFVPNRKKNITYTFLKRQGFLDRLHTLYYWEPEKEDFCPLKYSSFTDTTQTYSRIPANSLLWFTIPDRIVNQRVFYIENNNHCNGE